MLRSRFDTFAMVGNFIDEVGCQNISQWDYLKCQSQLGQPYQKS
jgi:hypothetical protein